MWGQPPSAVLRPSFIGPQQTPTPPHFSPLTPIVPSRDAIPTRERSETGEPALFCRSPERSRGESRRESAVSVRRLNGDAPFLASFARKPALSLPKGGIHRRHPHRILISKPTNLSTPNPCHFRCASAGKTGGICCKRLDTCGDSRPRLSCGPGSSGRSRPRHRPIFTLTPNRPNRGMPFRRASVARQESLPCFAEAPSEAEGKAEWNLL